MMARTHVAFGVLVALVSLPLVRQSDRVSFVFMVVLGSLLLDLDHPKSALGSQVKPFSWILSLFVRHRSMLHSLFFCAALSLGIAYMFETYQAIGILMGCLSHIVLDSFTTNGLNLLYPFATLHVKGFVDTGSLTETVIQLFIIIGIVAKLVLLIV